jgi:plastocyanin
LLDEVAAGGKLLDGAAFDRSFHPRKHCDQRHTLCDDDQSDDQHEKSVAEATHDMGSNAMARIVDRGFRWGRAVQSGTEMLRTGSAAFLRKLVTASLLLALPYTAVQATTASLAVTVQQRDGKPLPGAVITLVAEALRLPALPPVHAILDQLDLSFVPDVVVIPVGSSVSFPNSDAVSHQVYSFSTAHRFQLPLYRGKPYPPVVFDQAGVVTLGCNIHDNMLAYVIVTAAPFFGRTDAHGNWTGASLPSGRYRVALWHPLLNESATALDRVIEVAGDAAHLTLKLGKALRPAPLKSRPHSWDY